MKRSDLEHILRASNGVTGETEFIVIGSQAILGPFPDAPRVLRESLEADLYSNPAKPKPNRSSKACSSFARETQVTRDEAKTHKLKSGIF